MAAQPKTQQAKALIARTLSKDALLDMVATGWTQRKIAEHVTQLTGTPISSYYVCKALQSYGPDYEAAKKAQAAYHAERVAELTDKLELGQMDPGSVRVASENRRWLAAKLSPQDYADRQSLDVTVADVTESHLNALRNRLATMIDVTPKRVEQQ